MVFRVLLGIVHVTLTNEGLDTLTPTVPLIPKL